VDLPRRVVALLQRQLGVAGRRQLLVHLSAGQVDAHVRRGRLVRLERGVYRLSGSAVVPGQRAIAAALRAGPGTCLTGPAVLGFRGVDGFDADGPFELLVPRGRRLPALACDWRPDPHPSRRVTRRGAVRLAVCEDAVVHSTRWRSRLGDRNLRLAVHWLGWRGDIDRERFLERLLARAPSEPDAAAMLEILGGIELGRCESDGEVALGRLACCFDPRPEPQVWVTATRRVDWYFASLRLALEYDGGVDHPAGSAADRRRDRELERGGIRVLRVTADELRDPDAVLARIAEALLLRALELGVRAPSFDPTGRR
jgi:hypothetical protein